MTRRLWAAANLLFLVMFALSVVVQFNDPDPVRWIAIYGAAGLACGVTLGGRLRWWLPAAVAAAAGAWSATIAPRVVGRVPWRRMFEAWEMRDLGVEESREMYGLLIVAVWMTVLAIRARRSAKRPEGPPH
jgi:hypothetical protein